MIIHCIGDSHANFFSGFDEMQPEWPAPDIKNRIPQLRSYRFGPVLAYKLCEYGTNSRGREKMEQLLGYLSPGDHLLFCFGEIDCRAHVMLQAERQQRSPAEIIERIVERYMSTILTAKSRGFQPLIWAVIPSAPTDINSRIIVPPQYLFHGTREERNRITRIFNARLRNTADAEDIPFIDIYSRLRSGTGQPDRSFFSDEIHLSQKAMPFALEAFSELFGDAFSNLVPAGDPDQVFYSKTPVN